MLTVYKVSQRCHIDGKVKNAGDLVSLDSRSAVAAALTRFEQIFKEPNQPLTPEEQAQADAKAAQAQVPAQDGPEPRPVTPGSVRTELLAKSRADLLAIVAGLNKEPDRTHKLVAKNDASKEQLVNLILEATGYKA